MPADSFLKANQRLTEAVQNASNLGLSHIPGFRDLLRIATEADRVIQYGRCMGLTTEQIDEVITAWRDHTPWPVDWDEVRAALVRRVTGERWRP